MILARKSYVSGIVQGVGFRYATVRKAREIGVVGYVRNLYDGRVEVYAEGNEEQIDALRRFLRQGPPLAHVEHVEEIECEPEGTFSSFEIRFSAP